MCLIIQKPADIDIPEEKLLVAFDNNPDGMGVMYVEDGKVVSKRCMPKDHGEVLAFYNKYKDRNLGIHFRWATHGATKKSMAHPFNVLHTARDDEDLYLMHNGVLSGQSTREKGASDTWHFIQDFLRPWVKKYGSEQLNDPIFKTMLGKHIGTNNKLLLLDNKGQFNTINSNAGDLKAIEGCWLSNTYSLRQSYRVPTYVDPYSYDYSTRTGGFERKPYVSPINNTPATSSPALAKANKLWEKAQTDSAKALASARMTALAKAAAEAKVPATCGTASYSQDGRTYSEWFGGFLRERYGISQEMAPEEPGEADYDEDGVVIDLRDVKDIPDDDSIYETNAAGDIVGVGDVTDNADDPKQYVRFTEDFLADGNYGAAKVKELAVMDTEQLWDWMTSDLDEAHDLLEDLLIFYTFNKMEKGYA